MSISRHQAVGAYRRWEPVDFDAEEAPRAKPGRPAPARPAPPRPPDAPPPGTAPAASEAASAPTADPVAELPPGLKLPTAEEIEQLHEEIRAAAFEEGQRQGYAEGHAAGLEAGHSAGYADGQAQVAAEAVRIAALADDLEQAFSGLDREVAEELMALAIEMARQMVRTTLERDPESIIETIRSALTQLPQTNTQIRLHADDLELVRAHLADQQQTQITHRLIEDSSLQRGEFRIDAQSAQIDGTLETRWRRVLESIGRERARFQVPTDDGEASA